MQRNNLIKQSAKLHYDKGRYESELGQHNDAVNSFEKAIKLKNDNVDAYLERGKAYQALHDYENAAEDFKKAIELDNSVPNIYVLLGDALHSQRNYAEARSCYQTAHEKDVKNPTALRGLASVAYDQQDYMNALVFFKHAIHEDPRYSRAYFGLGRTLRKLNQHQDASIQLRLALHYISEEATAMFKEGKEFLSENKKVMAIGSFTKSLNLLFNTKLVLNEIGLTEQALQGQITIKTEKAMSQINLNYAITYQCIAKAHQALGNFEAAQNALSKYTEHHREYEAALSRNRASLATDLAESSEPSSSTTHDDEQYSDVTIEIESRHLPRKRDRQQENPHAFFSQNVQAESEEMQATVTIDCLPEEDSSASSSNEPPLDYSSDTEISAGANWFYSRECPSPPRITKDDLEEQMILNRLNEQAGSKRPRC